MAGDMIAEAAQPDTPAVAAAAPDQEPVQPAGPFQQGTTNKLFSFGVIADVQYANIADGWNWNETRRRYFRDGLVQLRRAVDFWLGHESHSFALQLGDCIDGRNRPDRSEAAVKDVKEELDRLADALPLGVISSLGNHELYNFPKEIWARLVDCTSRSKAATLRPPASFPSSCHGDVNSGAPFFMESATSREGTTTTTAHSNHTVDRGTAEEESFYFSFCPDPIYRFISLYAFDVHAIREGYAGKDADKELEFAERFLSERNPNEDKNDSRGIDGLGQRFVQYNGGVGAKQMRWLESQLAQASRAGQRVVLFGHLPVHPGASESKCLLWNFDELLSVLHRYDCVAMFISGHAHKDGYHSDHRGIHHVVLPAALETPADKEAFASIDVYLDRLELRGRGVVPSRTMLLPGRVGELLVG